MDPYSAYQAPRMEFPEPIRTRPGMYIGGTALFGLVHYFVSAIVPLLAHGATYISVKAEDNFEITSDAKIVLERTDAGIVPFEVIQPTWQGGMFEGAVLNALSEELYVCITTANQREELHFARGVRTFHRSTEIENESTGITLRFRPDADIFTVTEISPTVFESYFRRLSLLHTGVRFSLSLGGKTQVFQTDNGIHELFTALASPCQLMHEPIQFFREDGNLKLQLVMAYQSWRDNHLWCFINNGRAVEGGTHEDGLTQALKRIRTKLALPERFKSGVVAVMFVQYPNVQWRGCIKANVSNPELRTMVSRLVVEGTLEWLQNRPDVAAQISQLETFTFPDAW